jgi:hypothetical protein
LSFTGKGFFYNSGLQLSLTYGCNNGDIHKKGLQITVEDHSKPMGMLKIDHLKKLLKMDRIKVFEEI